MGLNKRKFRLYKFRTIVRNAEEELRELKNLNEVSGSVFKIKNDPQIICLWQVGGRSDIPFEKWMALDMEYIDTWSLLLDFKILARTIPAVLKVSGAA